MLDYYILTFPWLVPPDTIHSFIKTSNQLNKKTESVKNRPICSNLYTSYTSGTSKILNNYDCLGKRHINQKQKKSTQNLFLHKNEKSSRERKVFVFFQQDQTTITNTSHKGFAWIKDKKKHTKHNHNSIMMVWTQQNRKKNINSLGCLPTSVIV